MKNLTYLFICVVLFNSCETKIEFKEANLVSKPIQDFLPAPVVDPYFIKVDLDGKIVEALVPENLMRLVNENGQIDPTIMPAVVLIKIIAGNSYELTNSLPIPIMKTSGVIWTKDTVKFLCVGTDFDFESICNLPVDTNKDHQADIEITLNQGSDDFYNLRKNIKYFNKDRTEVSIKKYLQKGQISEEVKVN